MDLKIKYIPNSKGEKVGQPFYATQGSAGMDLSACIDGTHWAAGHTLSSCYLSI